MDWIHPLLPGLLSLAGVWLGFKLKNNADHAKTLMAWEREDLHSQRKAMADFLERWRDIQFRFHQEPQELAVNFATSIKKARRNSAYKAEKLKAVEVLSLSIREPTVSATAENLEQAIIEGEGIGEAYACLKDKAREHLAPKKPQQHR